MTDHRIGMLTLLCLAGAFAGPAFAQSYGQAEVSSWGNLRGVRSNDQLVPMVSAIGIFSPDYTQATLTQREGPTRTTQYDRQGNTVTVSGQLRYTPRGNGAEVRATPAPAATPPATTPATNPAGQARRNGGNGGGRQQGGPGLNYTVAYADGASGQCAVHVRVSSTTALPAGGVYYFITLPAADFAGSTAGLVGDGSAAAKPLAAPDERGRFLSGKAGGLRVESKNHQTVELTFPSPTEVVVRPAMSGDSNDLLVFFPVVVGDVAAGQEAETSFAIKVSAEADTRPATVAIDATKTGRPFDGIGGNYRIQSPQDPAHIDYIFKNLRVAYGRVAMPWNAWQPDENTPAADVPPANQPNTMNDVGAAMNMAATLAKKNIPMVISVWSPPQWAVLTPPNSNGNRGGGGGRRLDPAKYDAVCRSIGSYLVYLKEHYGAEPELFSFNESNIGINVRQSPQDHADAIKKLGAHFKSIGLKTKILLGDTGDVPPFDFVKPAMNDPEAVPFIGGISFHSWRGATDAQYQKWADAAATLGVPLLDGEGGNDAQAYAYPAVFREPWYSLDEAAEYVRIMRICQPRAILQWQFTKDYTVLDIDNNGTVRPTQRFYNLRQMNLTPAGSLWTGVQSSSPLVLAAAFTDAKSGTLTTHLVNNGAARQVTITGLPRNVTRLNVYVTNQSQNAAEMAAVEVHDASATLTLPATSFVTLINPGS